MASKTDIARALAQTENISIKDAASILDTTLKLIGDTVKTGEKVGFIGFGTFSQRTTKERQGRNPRTGASITIPARTSMHFKVSSSLVTKATRSTTRQAAKGKAPKGRQRKGSK
jgi:DNA-binding protein HU-beta